MAAWRSPPSGNRRVLPEMTQHLEQVRLATAKEAADPSCFLIGLANAIEVGTDDFLNAVGVLAFAHESGELTAQLCKGLFVVAIDESRLPLIDQRKRSRIPLQNVFYLPHSTRLGRRAR